MPAKRKRNYRREYLQYHAKPAQKKRRAARNRIRRTLESTGRVAKGDGRDVHHVDGNPLNESRRNVRVISRSANRRMNKKKGKR